MKEAVGVAKERRSEKRTVRDGDEVARVERVREREGVAGGGEGAEDKSGKWRSLNV